MKTLHAQVRRRRSGAAAGARLFTALAVLTLSAAASAISHAPATRVSAAVPGDRAHAGSCPVAGQCAVNPKTNCPTMGPLHASPPQKCVAIPVKTFWVSATIVQGGNAGCQSEIIVRVRIPTNSDQYEAVVYSNIGAGTRWWSTPDPGGQPGHTIANGAARYTVPAGYHAWQVAGGVSWGVHCSSTFPPKIWLGDGAWAVVTPQIAGGGTIAIYGSTKNKYNTHFHETVSGTATGGANYVVSGEQLDARGGCAPTPNAEAAKGPQDWMQWPTGTGPVHGHFSLVASFFAANLGTHGMCSYLINKSTKQTYAHASHWWTNLYATPVPGSGTIRIHGSTKNAMGTHFSQTVSGTADGGANYVISGEQLTPTGGCAADYLNESGKFGNWRQWPTGTGAVHGHFSLVAKFFAASQGTHGICSYLINKTTKQTYAHAANWWTNS